MHRIPRSVVEPAAAEDLRHQISVADPAAMGDGCVHAHCQQDVVSREHGFPTCQLHTDLMVEWDDLVAS
jgi:hypothetical protein